MTEAIRPQPGIMEIALYQGGASKIEGQSDPLKLSSNENPFGASPAAIEAVAEAARMLAPGGRLLIVDFAPHALEFLRERHAHRRLGFGHGPMEQWVRAAALDLEAVVDLGTDESATGKLTVTLWLARDRRVVVAGDAAEREIA